MAANDFDQESILTFVSELDKRVGDLKKEVASLADVSGKSMQQAGAATEKFGDAIEKNIKPLKGMRDQASGLTRMLTGAVGIGTAFYGAAKAMEHFAVSGLQARNFATDLGLSTAAVGKFQSQLQAAGIDGKTANQQLGALAAHLDDIKTYETASATYKAVAANDPILAKRLLDAERAGDRLKSFQWIKEKWGQAGEPRTKLFMGETLGVNQSTMQALLRNQEGLIQPRQYSPEQLEEYNAFMWNALTISSNAWGSFMQFMVEDTNKFIVATKKEFQGLGSWFQGVRDSMKKPGGTDLTGSKGIFPSAEEIKNLLEKGSATAAPYDEATGSGVTDWGDRTDAATFDERFGSGFAQRFGSWAPVASVQESIFREKFEAQKSSHQLLIDIRDLIIGDDEHGGSGAGGGFRFGGGGSGGNGSSGGPVNLGATGEAIGAISPKGGGRSGYNYFQHRGDAPIRDPKQLAIIDTKWGKLRVHPEAADDFATFYSKLAEYNAPVGTAGTYNLRQKRWGGGWSSHSYAAAHDIGDSQFFSPAMAQWIRANPEKWKEALASGNIGQPLTDASMVGGKDPAHVEWKGPRLNPDGTVAKQQNARQKIDSSFPGMRKDSARVDVEFNGMPKGVKTEAELLEQGVFNTLNIRKSTAQQQAN